MQIIALLTMLETSMDRWLEDSRQSRSLWGRLHTLSASWGRTSETSWAGTVRRRTTFEFQISFVDLKRGILKWKRNFCWTTMGNSCVSTNQARPTIFDKGKTLPWEGERYNTQYTTLLGLLPCLYCKPSASPHPCKHSRQMGMLC